MLVSVLVVAALMTLYGMGRRNSLIRDTQANLLFNATLTAQGFDANLRIADIVLASFARGFAAGRIDVSDTQLVAKRLIDHANEIGVVDNIYLLDSDWNVILMAFDRIEPTLEASLDLRSRLRSGDGPEVLIVRCPAEGGSILALIYPLSSHGRRYFIAALFSGSDIAGRVEPLRIGGRGRIAIQDRTGNMFFVGGIGVPPVAEHDPTLEASSSFSSYPLKALVSAAREEVLGRWWTEVRFLIVAMSVFCAAVVALGFYSARLRRRRLQVDALESALEADATLFKEINHRIKNNLVVVEGVLNLGVGQYEDGSRSGKQILESAKDRVHSIALVHELLYKGKGSQSINLADYIVALRDAIGSAYDPVGRIEQGVEIDGSIELNFDIAVPCGMILSELITNSYKYAFPGERRGRICVDARRVEGGDIELVARDDGVGFPTGSATAGGKGEDATSAGLGTLLVAGLADQLKGSIERDVDYRPGVKWVLRFPAQAKGSGRRNRNN